MPPASPASTAYDVTVVIALHNKRDYVRDALRSIAAQTHQPTEIIVIDDGSTDGSDAIVEALGMPNLRLIRQARSGPGPARNRGMAEARTPYVAFIDADDLWTPDHLETLAEVALAYPDAALIGTDYQQFSGSPPYIKSELPSATPRRFAFFEESRNRDRIWVGNAAVQPEQALALGGFGDAIPGEDQYLWHGLALHSEVAVVDRVTAYYRTNTGGLMDQASLNGDAVMVVPAELERLHNYLADHPDAKQGPAIHAYAVSRWAVLLKQTLYRGQRSAGRWIIAQMQQRDVPVPRHLTILSALPSPALSLTLALHGMRKRIAGSAPVAQPEAGR